MKEKESLFSEERARGFSFFIIGEYIGKINEKPQYNIRKKLV